MLVYSAGQKKAPLYMSLEKGSEHQSGYVSLKIVHSWNLNIYD